MRRAVAAGIFLLGSMTLACWSIACATPPIDESLETDDTTLPNRPPVPEAGAGGDTGAGGSADSGASDSAIGVADAGVDAAAVVPSGAYSGMYTNNRTAFGCTFMNAGTLNATFTTATDLTTTADVTGLEIRDQDCFLVGKVGGQANSSMVTNTAGTFTGTWNLNVNGGGQLAMPFTAKLSGKTLTGSWTCTGCTGTFTLMHP